MRAKEISWKRNSAGVVFLHSLQKPSFHCFVQHPKGTDFHLFARFLIYIAARGKVK